MTKTPIDMYYELVICVKKECSISNNSCAAVKYRQKSGRAERGRERERHKSHFCSFSESYLQQWETETARGRE